MTAEENQITSASRLILIDEAWEFFRAEAGVGTDKRTAFQNATDHLITHALDEGIVVPGWQMDPGTEGSLAFHAANLTPTIDELASAIAISEGYNPNNMPVNAWNSVKKGFEKRAEKISTILWNTPNSEMEESP